MGRFQSQILVAGGLCYAADAMEVLLLSFLSVVLQVEWHLTNGQTATLTSSVLLGSVMGCLALGSLGDVYGRRPVFIATAAMISIFGLLTATAQNFASLVLYRFLVGCGVGGLTIPFDTLAELCPQTHRARHLIGGTGILPSAEPG